MNNKNLMSGIKFTVAVVLAGMIFLTSTASVYSKNVFDSISDNVVRLHVIANSDSEEDQKLKLKVRDAIIEYSQNLLGGYASPDDVIDAIKENREEMKSVAEKCLREEGCTYTADIYVGEYDFPAKNYGNYCFPTGKYNAVRVVIGEGVGKNWWCVLFPPLCYMSENAVSVSCEAEEVLKENLSGEAFDTVAGNVTESNNIVKDSAGIENNVKVSYKFKIVELFQKITSLF